MMVISVYENASEQVYHAVGKLSEFTGINLDSDGRANRVIKILLNDKNNPEIGDQGYSIKSESDSSILIHGNTDVGVANGIYTFLRNLRIKSLRNPFELSWNLAEQPFVRIREMIVAPYRFGGSFGYEALSPDRWTITEWMTYIDFMRLCNMTTLVIIASGRIYHPDYPHTHREKWRYEIWRDVIKYCHKVGMKCNWITFPNTVPQEVYWANPDLRVSGQEAGGYFGCGLNWNKAKDIILDVNRYTYEYLNELDGLEMLYSEAGFSLNKELSSDPAGYFADVTNSYREILNKTGEGKDFVFWNWVFDLWSNVILPESLLEEYPKFRTILDDLIPLLPKDITWVDASMLSVIQMFGVEIKDRGNPPLREGLLLGREKGFETIINCFWYMNPEYALNFLPHPFIRRAMQEAKYTRDELNVDGVMGYRLAPPCKFLEDYAFFRVASDPGLTQEQLVTEMAGMLCERPENKKMAYEAINLLEEFWTTHDLQTLETTDKLFSAVLENEKSEALRNLGHAVTFLYFIVKIAQPGVAEENKSDLKRELYARLKTMYIFQGITSDIIWQPESYVLFFQKIDIMVKQYNWYKAYIPDIVDRDIYQNATSNFASLNWQDSADYNATFSEEFGKMPGPLSL